MKATARTVTFSASGGSLRGELRIPAHPEGIVVVTAGSCGLWRTPPESTLRTRLHSRGIGTFATDLLTAAETSTRRTHQDLDLLARRIETLRGWLDRQGDVGSIDVALYGADTAGAAALQAVDDGVETAAIALRNGRIDLIEPALSSLETPVLCVDRNRRRQSSERVIEDNHRIVQRTEMGGSAKQITEWFQQELLTHSPREI